MEAFTPNKNGSVQDMLKALGFVYYEPEECFGKDNVKIPLRAIIGHDPVTFYALMKEKGWLKDEAKAGDSDQSNLIEQMYGRLFTTDLLTVGQGSSPFTLESAVKDAEDRYLRGQGTRFEKVTYTYSLTQRGLISGTFRFGGPTGIVQGGPPSPITPGQHLLIAGTKTPVRIKSVDVDMQGGPPDKPVSVAVYPRPRAHEWCKCAACERFCTATMVADVVMEQIATVVFQVYLPKGTTPFRRDSFPKHPTFQGLQGAYNKWYLPPGTYDFEVYSVNEQGQESERVRINGVTLRKEESSLEEKARASIEFARENAPPLTKPVGNSLLGLPVVTVDKEFNDSHIKLGPEESLTLEIKALWNEIKKWAQSAEGRRVISAIAREGK